MNPKIISCVNEKIRQQQIAAKEQIEREQQQRKTEQEIKEGLIDEIYEFFKGFDASIEINLYKDTIDGYRVSYNEKIPIFRNFTYEQIHIYNFCGICIEGISNYNRRDKDPFRFWSLGDLKIFVKNLGWIEDRIAEKYGCGN